MEKIKMLVYVRFATVVVTLLALSTAFFCVPETLRKILVLIAIGAVFVTMAIDRNHYLRFLGRAVFPTGLIKETYSMPGAETVKTLPVDAPEGSVVVYWAANQGEHPDPKTAYGGYYNAGSAIVNRGQVTFVLRGEPGAYGVPMRGELPRHIHYRYVEAPGMLSEVKTAYY